MRSPGAAPARSYAESRPAISRLAIKFFTILERSLAVCYCRYETDWEWAEASMQVGDWAWPVVVMAGPSGVYLMYISYKEGSGQNFLWGLLLLGSTIYSLFRLLTQ